MATENWEGLAAELPAAVTEVLCPGAPVVVTGCAGFIGSTVTEALLALGCRVTGVDALTDYYDPALKHENMAGFRDHPDFTFVQEHLEDLDAVALLAGRRACLPPGGPGRGARQLGRLVRRLPELQHHGHPAPAGGLPRRRGSRTAWCASSTPAAARSTATRPRCR